MRIAWLCALITCVSLLFGCGGGGGGTAVTRYVVTDLGTVAFPSGPDLTQYPYLVSKAVTINSSGMIALQSNMTQTAVSSYRIVNGTKTNLGIYWAPLAMNNAGTVLFRNGEYTDSGFVDMGGTFGNNFSPKSLNNNGQIVGTVSVNSFPGEHCGTFSNGVVTDLGQVGEGVAINDSGQITLNTLGGPQHTATNVQNVILFSNGASTDVGSLGGDHAVAFAMNNSAQIVGSSTLGPDPISDTHAFLYSNGNITDLGVLSGGQTSIAFSINSAGKAVGLSSLNGQLNLRAVLFENGTAVDLNSRLVTNTGWLLVAATGINDTGQIVGVGALNGSQHAFLITPQ